MKHPVPSLLASLVLIASAPLVRADDPASNTSFKVGASYGRISAPGLSTDVAGFGAGFNWELGEFLNTDLGWSVDYHHLESTGNKVFKRDDLDTDLRFGFGLMGIFKPYVAAGLSFDHNDAPAYTAQKDWTAGYALGGGVGITVVPGLLHTTPSVRYVNSNNLDTITYSLDTALHFSLVGVGLRLDYEDNQTRDGHLASAMVYAGLRF